MRVLTSLTVLTVIAFAACADRAAAQVVAGALPGPTLDVADATEDGAPRLELTLTSPDPDEPAGRALDLEGGEPPVWPDDATIATASVETSGSSTLVYFGGAVTAEAAAVELTFKGGVAVRVPTVAGEAYAGREAGRVRFFLGEATLAEDTDDDPELVRLFDAAGAVIGVPRRSPLPSQSVRVLRRRIGHALVRAWVRLGTEVSPLPGAPEHREERLCTEVGVQSVGDEPSVACQDLDVPLEIGGRRGCGRVPTTLAGFVPTGTDRLDVTLGSGRRVGVAARSIPFGRPGRMVATFLPRGEAIRSATALAADGRVLARGAVRVAPPDRRCGTDYRYDDWSFYGDLEERPGLPPETEEAATLGAGGPRLLVRDSGERLCLGIDTLDLNGLDCSAPPTGGDDSDDLYADAERGLVAGVFPARVAMVELAFLGGARTRVPAVAATGYTGRYRDAVHFVLAAVPAGRFVIEATLLDGAGRWLGTAYVSGPDDDRALVGRPSTILRAGSSRLVTGTFSTPLEPKRRGRCIAIDDEDCLDSGGIPTEANSVNVRVRCDRRRTVVFGVARHGVSRVDIMLAGGRRVQAKVAAFGAQKVYLAALGPRIAVTGVHFTGGPATNGHTFVLPGRAPADQCGYESRGELF
jgi:hypothetical protein